MKIFGLPVIEILAVLLGLGVLHFIILYVTDRAGGMHRRVASKIGL